ncbi:endolytic transglycosylase MltG [Autumnicola edwardsiae]|uniref:Endolytic murein transglycosylase n=1 Tax=Autumnicola edwardsiae TaxID=3075594 RepID=A0ABU3CTB2_9FLAO|nr:endolytic transglycosylase MltG [Zunongwangia sp. F297]MDT0649596.1 endolytic transglycosylase MltG [Zunongwangia sp. F297]
MSKKNIIFIVAAVVVIALSAVGYYAYTSVFSANTDFSEEQAVVYIPTGADYNTLVDSIQPLLKNIESFEMVAEKKGYKSSIRPGRYILKRNMNNNEIVNVLRSRNAPVKVRFNNQERLENLAGRISNQIEADSAELLQAMKDQQFLAKNNMSEREALSLYIPNQYEFYWNTSAEEFRKRMQQEYNRFWTEERLEKAEEINLTPTQVMVLASIVQKETAKVDERPKVAGVYMNRYKNGWKLDADPTVIYAIKDESQKFDTIIKRVLYKDLKLDSPYNTYLYKEIPPGPITMPDISSIDAVLNYQDHDFFYFVADVQNFGYHKFAETLAQHNRNKREYVRWINQQGIRR